MLEKEKTKLRTEDENRLDQWFREYYEELHCAAMAYFTVKSAPGSPAYQLAEEAVQETFVTAWEKRTELLSAQSPKGWLYRTLKNKVQNMSRVEWTLYRHFVQVQEDEETAAQDLSYQMAELRSCIREEEYRLLKRLYLDGSTYREISQETGLSQSALAMRVSRIKQKIRAQSK